MKRKTESGYTFVGCMFKIVDKITINNRYWSMVFRRGAFCV